MQGYRHVKYDPSKQGVHFWSWNSLGVKSYDIIPFKPYLFVPSTSESKFDAISITGEKLTKKEFKNSSERNKFVENYKSLVYHNIPVEQQFLLDRYGGNFNADELIKHPLKVFYLDIEVYSPDEFPYPSEAKHPINAIAIYDTETKLEWVFGLGNDYDPETIREETDVIEPKDIRYVKCVSEIDLLKKFLRFWRKDFPDVVATWNGSTFDIPYIVNRLKVLFGEEAHLKLSPIGSIYGRDVFDKFGRAYVEYSIDGVSHIDYMLLYRYFARNEVISDKLEDVCQEELNRGKVALGYSSLVELCDNDWNKFINYNIMDVKLMELLDRKLRYLDIARYVTTIGLCNLPKVLGKLACITGILAVQAASKGCVIPTYRTTEPQEKIPGGYVKDAVPGLYRNVVSFDANSLYPNTMVTLNLSPETKVGKILRKEGDEYTIQYKGNNYKATKDRFHEFIRKRNLSVSAAGILFDQDRKGIAASFVEELYAKRVEHKRKMLAIEKKIKTMDEGDPDLPRMKEEAGQLDIRQYLYKILLNSTYGAFANQHFVLYDRDCAMSITLTGQAMIKKTEQIINNTFTNVYGLPEKDRVVAIDTDSNYVLMDDLLKHRKIDPINEDGSLNEEYSALEGEFEDHLNRMISDWARESLNSADPRFEFKREAVCTTAIWLKKKHYILKIRNNEGVPVNKTKISGLQVVKAFYSPSVKKIIRNIIDKLLDNPDKKSITEIYRQSEKAFADLHIDDTSTTKNIKTMAAYANGWEGFKTRKSTPNHVKCAFYFNHILKLLGLDGKYTPISSGQKIKMVYLKPNKYGIKFIGFPDVLPPEFGLAVDTSEMFRRTVVKQLQSIYDALGWHLVDLDKDYTNDLLELFGED